VRSGVPETGAGSRARLAPTLPSSVAVDPRFRARRIAVRRDEGRRRLKRLLGLVGVAAVALAAVIVLRSPVLDVDEVAVSGTERLDAEQLREVAGIGIGRPILLADLDGAAEALEALPWIARAEVTRDLPGTVRVAVREREAAAVVGCEQARAGHRRERHAADQLGVVVEPALCIRARDLEVEDELTPGVRLQITRRARVVRQFQRQRRPAALRPHAAVLFQRIEVRGRGEEGIGHALMMPAGGPATARRPAPAASAAAARRTRARAAIC